MTSSEFVMSMRKSRITVIILGMSLVIALYFYASDFISPKRSSQIIDSLEVRNGEMTVRVTVFSETNSIVPGAYYTFESVNRADLPVEILTFRHDDPVPIDKNWIVFLNEKIAYVFMGWMYAITHDSGKTWAVWDGSKEFRDWKCCNYSLIKQILVNEDGTGEMHLSDADGNLAGILVTGDYGQTWRTNL